MSKFIRLIDNKTIEISDYKSPNRCFETNEYGDWGNFDVYCVFKEKINPFSLYVENQRLKEENVRLNNIITELEKLLENPYNVDCINQNNAFLQRIKELKEGMSDE